MRERYGDGAEGDWLGQSGYSIAASGLKMLGHGSLLAFAGLGIAAMLGSAWVSIGDVAGAGLVATGCMLGGEALQSRGMRVETERKRRWEAEIEREDAAVDIALLEMAGESAEQTSGQHVERLTCQRVQQARGKGL